MYVLDTDHLSFLDRPNSDEGKRILHRMEDARQDGVATTIVNYEEHTRGWLAFVAKAKSVATLVDAYRRLESHLTVYRSIPVLGFDVRAATRLQDLKSKKPKVGTVDLRIAAIVLVHDATLVTRNRVDFEQVPGLKISDWSDG
jgi:tRNA(fMet)-specific endonuclease VapC